MQVDTYDVHFAAIRKALRHGNAAVMVGAGFSRNARNGQQLATWADMSNELWQALNPDEPAPSSFSTSIVTQLGEQYARVFSKPALEEVLKRLIPDERVHPGTVHAKLLALPWVEIFTTNYDTLLERAADDIVDRAHYTVTCREDIPQSKILSRRRIVKLHGSFPSQRPFIFTEDEYRKYPFDFAPFVNLVRQSLLENVFCLVGFSGDDPNFLHWIGWVRDMLDQHALPIYLLLNRPPSLGQQKLLDARQVTPIVIPLPPGIEADDYPARLEAFFQAVDPAQDPEDKEWGPEIFFHSGTGHTNDLSGRKAATLAVYEELASFRKTYPGWLVAPESVRSRLRFAADHSAAFTDRHALLSLLLEDIHVATVLLADYAWFQEVTLQSMDDELAAEARRILSATAEANSRQLKEQGAILQRFGAASLRQYRVRWKALALALLRWAREGLHRDMFEEAHVLLRSSFPDDAQLEDEAAHQAVLLALYEGDRLKALRRLNSWEVKGADGYMLVRKGSLLSELGEVDRGFSISLSGLQQLRRDQRSRSDITRYLSEEAWACAVIGRQQSAVASPLTRSKDPRDAGQFADQLSRRLVELAARGMDVNGELERLNAALDAEATMPSEPKSVMPAFDLGQYSISTTLGSTARLQDKLDAAFAWLTLAERVALVPRIGNTIFSVNSFLCAGWWVQYADSMRRVLSVLMRTMSTKALDNRGPSDPHHTSGWLSRFQVGKTDASLAIRICESSLSLVEGILAGELSNDVELTLSFHIQIFARLVIRVSDAELVESYARRVIAMHQRDTVAKRPRLWQHFGMALARCFEAMPPIRQRQLLPNIWEIASRSLPDSPHFRQRWVPLHLFHPRAGVPLEVDGELLARLGTNAIMQVIGQQTNANSGPQWEAQRAWEYLYLLSDWSLLSGSEKEAICQAMWQGADPWPVLRGFHPEAAFAWGEPDGVDHHEAFRAWILARLVPSFPSEGALITRAKDGHRSWGLPVDNTILCALNASFERQPWPRENAEDALGRIRSWWRKDWPEIVIDIDSVDELKAALVERLDCIDIFLAFLVSHESLQSIVGEVTYKAWVEEMLNAALPYGASFGRYRIARALANEEDGALWEATRQLVQELGDPDISVAVRTAPQVVAYWLEAVSAHEREAFRFLLTAIAGFIAARRMPALPWMLQIAAAVVVRRPSLFDSQALSLIEVGLSKMLQELSYKERKEGSGIPDDNVPDLRHQCARLAFAMRERLNCATDCVVAWTAEAVTDPLPEMRFLALQSRQRGELPAV